MALALDAVIVVSDVEPAMTAPIGATCGGVARIACD
jgi:hypothetical protein